MQEYEQPGTISLGIMPNVTCTEYL